MGKKNSYILGVLILVAIIFTTMSMYNNKNIIKIKELDEVIAMEHRKAYDYFAMNTNKKDSKAYGLTKDRNNGSSASIASVGYSLSALPIGVENGWIDKKEAEDTVVKMLNKTRQLERVNGFFYHFYNYYTGDKLKVEVSNIDTAIYLMGAIFAGEYFGGEAKRLAKEIYDEVNWPWFFDNDKKQFYMGFSPTKKGYKMQGHWDVYAEHLMMIVLASGSDTYPVTDCYEGFKRFKGTYKEHTFINSWFGAIFTYQFSHGFIDFRDIIDKDGVNWFDNSVQAVKANRQYAIDNPKGFKSFSQYGWGMTAGDGPSGYSGLYGAQVSGTGKLLDPQFKNDGTINPYGVLSSIVFIPEEVITSANYWYDTFKDDIFSTYGFVDGYNEDKNWFSKNYIGIDKGSSLVMIENYRSELIWKNVMANDNIQKALRVIGFSRR